MSRIVSCEHTLSFDHTLLNLYVEIEVSCAFEKEEARKSMHGSLQSRD